VETSGADKWKWELNHPLPEFRIELSSRGLKTGEPRFNFQVRYGEQTVFLRGFEYAVEDCDLHSAFPFNQKITAAAIPFTIGLGASSRHL